MLPINEQYQHPYWQRKRLEIFRRDQWQCQCCGETNKALHVHHLHYEKDLHIWEYDNESLVTVCHKCHRILHKELSKLSGIIAFKILSGEMDVNSLDLKVHPQKTNNFYEIKTENESVGIFSEDEYIDAISKLFRTNEAIYLRKVATVKHSINEEVEK